VVLASNNYKKDCTKLNTNQPTSFPLESLIIGFPTYQRYAWTVFWIFWARTPAASNKIRSEVFFPVAGSDGFGFCVYWKNVTSCLLDLYLPRLKQESDCLNQACTGSGFTICKTG